VACGLVGAAPAAAKKVTCGQVIIENTKVSNDLKNCSGDGLVIGADDITLNLNGHTIDGDDDGNDNGIVIQNHDGVTVKNGTVQQFAEGVVVGSSSSNDLIQKIVSQRNSDVGVLVSDDSDHTTLRGNTADKNTTVGFAVGLNTTSTNILANRATRNGEDGIRVVATDNGTSIGNNTANDNDDDGIDANAGTDDAGGNRAHGNADQQCIGVACN
jgi:parallel beta-helix repeat protein